MWRMDRTRKWCLLWPTRLSGLTYINKNSRRFWSSGRQRDAHAKDASHKFSAELDVRIYRYMNHWGNKHHNLLWNRQLSYKNDHYVAGLCTWSKDVFPLCVATSYHAARCVFEKKNWMVRQRQTERDTEKGERVRERERMRERVCVCVCLCVIVCLLCMSVCACVSVCVWEKERERDVLRRERKIKGSEYLRSNSSLLYYFLCFIELHVTPVPLEIF